MYNLWNPEKRFPKFDEIKKIENTEYINVHTATDREYKFLLGANIIRHNDVFYASWGNSGEKENDDNTVLAQKTSLDGGKSWGDFQVISRKDEGFGRSHGVFLEYEGSLYAFCPKAKYKYACYSEELELKMEVYRLNNEKKWEWLGIVTEDDFWPLCEPVVLENGTIIMGGLEINEHRAAVALCDGKDLTKWKRVVLPNPECYTYWGETTVMKKSDKLVAVVRYGGGCALVSESMDSKLYAGTLSTGENYIVFNAQGEKYRDTLCVAVGEEYFERVYIIRHGFDKPPVFQEINEWCYPYAYEDEGKLYVIYANNKENCELAIIPLESLGK